MKAIEPDKTKEMLIYRNGGHSWEECAARFGISSESIRKRVSRYVKKCGKTVTKYRVAGVKDTDSSVNIEEHTSGGEIILDKKIFVDGSFDKDSPVSVLKNLGYDPENWTLVNWRVSNWQNFDGKDLYAIRALVRPKEAEDLQVGDYVNFAKEAFSSVPAKKRVFGSAKSGNRDLMMEIPPIELHYGKRAHTSDVPCNYNTDTAEKIFFNIFDEIIRKQKSMKCGKCLLVIGNDFFNAESTNMTTNGTPQQNDGRYKKLFVEGLHMYETAIDQLAENFDSVDVMLCVGNHARSMEFFLYAALQQRYRDYDGVNFSSNYRDTQAYVWGTNAIFFNHGDVNLKRTMASIPAEFAKEWGASEHRELHLGHLHKEVMVDEEGGMITRRISSPCATDDWHYTNRFIGADRKHQYFIWDSEEGLKEINYIHIKNS